MNTNFLMLKDLLEIYEPKRMGVASHDEVVLIEDTLHLKEMDILQLRNLRDFTVLFLSSRDRDGAAVMSNMDKMSAITTVIDRFIIKCGGEV